MVIINHKPRVCISILNWKNTSDTIACVHSLQLITSVSHQIVVLDNESTPESLATLQTVRHIKVISSLVNLGFAGGHNRVVKWALDQGFDYVWLLNNDAINQPNCLERLVDYADGHRESALVSPILLNNTLPHGPQHVISILNDTRTGSHEYTDVDVARKMQQDYPNKVIIWGTALLVRLSCIKTLGYLDERLFAYAEDTDYALRAISCGFSNAVVFEAYVWHASPTHPRKPHYYYYTHRNSIAIAKKHASRLNTLKLIYWNLRLAKKQLLVIGNDTATAHALKLGIWHGWINQSGPFNKEAKHYFFSDALMRFVLYLS
ncbi:putative glycosyl transferase family 2 [Rhodoferax antarcticus ANT.BR]|uniref:Putative glycosyl transferase family 2 n=2 Tax=Rhodoferax antarcticus TaxID=81479 RepID=A0A1Q8YHC3_9BURK|nr:hypothetical protein RA876_00445 [Rhodoferax antarcticus]OLP07319.1 putative glycosyl transferase family 2 [Rhodoferax antarcticus ANT.BR]